jgi:hypothetical protein
VVVAGIGRSADSEMRTRTCEQSGGSTTGREPTLTVRVPFRPVVGAGKRTELRSRGGLIQFRTRMLSETTSRGGLIQFRSVPVTVSHLLLPNPTAVSLGAVGLGNKPSDRVAMRDRVPSLGW